MMKRQMELFEDGGLKDEGGMVDKESGNKVPTGSTREEVRDDKLKWDYKKWKQWGKWVTQTKQLYQTICHLECQI